MRVVTQMLVMDRMNRDRLRSVPVITYRRVTPAENTCKAALQQSGRTHSARLAAPVI